jgi:hypothetical protein
MCGRIAIAGYGAFQAFASAAVCAEGIRALLRSTLIAARDDWEWLERCPLTRYLGIVEHAER